MNAKPCLVINDLNADLVSSNFDENLVNQIFADLWDSNTMFLKRAQIIFEAHKHSYWETKRAVIQSFERDKYISFKVENANGGAKWL